MKHTENHRVHRSGWLRAAVLGANDGIVSTASLIVGMAAAEAGRGNVILAGVAGLVAGSMSMAAGEYVSVKSQADTEEADLKLEARELERNWDYEVTELAGIYRDRGLDDDLAEEVARQMMRHDALGAHARDEIGITDELSARPFQAASASATTFAAGGALPLIAALLVSTETILWIVPAVAILMLGILGGLAASAGGASPIKGILRVCFWGTLAMALTALIGNFFNVSV